jgi:hypothetical protein
MKRTIIAVLAILSLATATQAGLGYNYAGVSHTAKVAHDTSVIITITHLPRQVYSQAIGWTLLWDTQGTGAYVEAGVGMLYPGGKPKVVSLWWASNSKNPGGKVGSVPLGTPVLVELHKSDGVQSVQVRWTWTTPNGRVQSISRSFPVQGWVNGPGIHSTKAEVYSSSATVNPNPFAIQFNDVTIYPEDTSSAYLQSTPPYVPAGTLTDFSVTYP